MPGRHHVASDIMCNDVNSTRGIPVTFRKVIAIPCIPLTGRVVMIRCMHDLNFDELKMVTPYCERIETPSDGVSYCYRSDRRYRFTPDMIGLLLRKVS